MKQRRSTTASTPPFVEALVEEYRDRCLWFLKPDYMPHTTKEILHVLDLVERYGDRSGYQRAEEIRKSLQ
jgi:hypothetical protein